MGLEKYRPDEWRLLIDSSKRSSYTTQIPMLVSYGQGYHRTTPKNKHAAVKLPKSQ